jgi:hypothetical protein
MGYRLDDDDVVDVDAAARADDYRNMSSMQ